MLTVHNAMVNNPEPLMSKEWLISNGIGGYASSTVCGLNTRRYHGLLVAATHPPVGRLVMLSKVEDALIVNGTRFDLSTNRYGEEVLHPQGFRNLQQFRLDPFPIYTYAGEGFVLEKSIYMARGENTVVIEYSLSSRREGDDIQLEIAPLIAFRDFHATTHANQSISPKLVESDGRVTLQPYGDLPALHIAHDADEVIGTGNWYYNFEYSEERARGLDHREDLFNPLMLRASLNGRTKVTLIASTEPHFVADAATIRAAEIRRTKEIERKASSLSQNLDLIRALSVAAEHFIVARPPFKTVIAGYHWFGDWGRDTMIALPGLLLCTEQPDAAKDILLQFLRYVHGGMLPNRFPDQGETPEYNTVDATLWFVDAIWQYLNYRNDARWRRDAVELIRTQFYPGLKSIIHHHLAGTRYRIHADAQGFLWAGDESTQLTWMDAKVGDIAITPRSGRAVEIQALWYNALRTVEEFGRMFGDVAAADYCAGVANRLRANFEGVFWNDSMECLYDVVGELSADPSIRPNQVIAVSLRHNLLDQDKTIKVLESAKKHLLTPFGLRTLAPSDPRYRARYQGDVWSRDSAYHQGTVWPWLAGPYFASLLRYADNADAALNQAQEWIDRFSEHLQEACLGQVSEIFDGDEPHNPGGCIAQAWSVAELLRLAKLVDERSRDPKVAARAEDRQFATAMRS